MSMEKITNSGRAVLATISPDGKYVVNVTDEGHGQQSLWMRHIATGSNTQIMPPTEVRYTGAHLHAERRLSVLRTDRAGQTGNWVSLPDSGAGRHTAQAG